MRWLVGSFHARRQRVWRDWFAWYPVRIDSYWVWLEVVSRAHVCGEEICYWSYDLKETL